MANNRIAEDFIDGIIFPQSRKRGQAEETAREEKINDLYKELTQVKDTTKLEPRCGKAKFLYDNLLSGKNGKKGWSQERISEANILLERLKFIKEICDRDARPDDDRTFRLKQEGERCDDFFDCDQSGKYLDCVEGVCRPDESPPSETPDNLEQKLTALRGNKLSMDTDYPPVVQAVIQERIEEKKREEQIRETLDIKNIKVIQDEIKIAQTIDSYIIIFKKIIEMIFDQPSLKYKDIINKGAIDLQKQILHMASTSEDYEKIINFASEIIEENHLDRGFIFDLLTEMKSVSIDMGRTGKLAEIIEKSQLNSKKGVNTMRQRFRVKRGGGSKHKIKLKRKSKKKKRKYSKKKSKRR